MEGDKAEVVIDPWHDGYKTGHKDGVIVTTDLITGEVKVLRMKIERLEAELAQLKGIKK